jgi:hypothetical protein
MGNPENTITINGVTYAASDLSDQQKGVINHLLDLDQKIRATQFQLDQLTVARGAFETMLGASLAAADDVEFPENVS